MNHRNGILRRAESEIYYDVAGEGPAIAFVHGLGGNHLSWWQQIPYFSTRFTCVSYAQRGFPPSRNLSGNIEIASFVDDLAALLQHLGIEEVALVAQSMGGWTCLDYAMREGSRVKGLVMASTTGTANFSIIDHPEVRRLPEWTAHAEEVRRDYSAKGILRSVGGRAAIENPALYYLYCRLFELTPTEYREAVRKKIHAGRILGPEHLAAFRVPTLFLTGAEDVVFPVPAAAAVASVMPNASLISVPEAGHSVYFDRATEFNAVVDKFLSPLLQ